VPTTASPAWQTNGVVRAVAYANGAVYLGGTFTSVRPPGRPPGSGEVARQRIAAFSATTGNLLPFNHNMNAAVLGLTVSPDRTRLYASGDFTSIDGQTRNRTAAFDLATGTLNPTWRPSANARVKGVSIHGGTIYLGGSFTAVNGQTRRYVAAVTDTGSLLPFTVTPDSSVRALIVSADGARLILGGSFNSVNGVARRALASINTTTGGLTPLAPTIPSCSQVTTLARTGTAIFVGAEGTGGGCFDGTLAFNASTGAQLWRDNCLGATQAVTVIDSWLYVGSHAHNCSGVPGGFPEVPPGQARHLMRESILDGRIDSSWRPNTNGNPLGPFALGTDGVRLAVGGDFTYVNNVAQQGFTRFG